RSRIRRSLMKSKSSNRTATTIRGALLALALLAAVLGAATGSSGAPQAGGEHISGRGNIHGLPRALRQRLVDHAAPPHTYTPMRVFAEADKPSQLFEYYLLDGTDIEPNVFTSIIPGINDHAIP